MPVPSISVVVPAYNAEAFLGEALESALGQTLPPLEVIVVDDGSTDGTAAVVKSFDSRVKYLFQQNARQAAARNTGLRRSRGGAVAFLDADDVWRNDKLEKQMNLLLSKEGLSCVYCSTQEIDSSGTAGTVHSARARGNVLQDVLLGRAGCGGGSTLFVLRSVLDKVGLFDEALSPCEDTDLFWRLAAFGAVDYVDETLVYYRQHEGNAHRNVKMTTLAWKRLYAKALCDPSVQSLGALFRAQARGRLYYMLAGDHARAGNWTAALWYCGWLAMMWPPGLLRVVGQLSRRTP